MLVLGLALPVPLAAQEVAVFNTLHKITAQVSRVSVPVAKPRRLFGHLDVLVRTCRKAPPEETPEVSAFVQVTGVRQGKKEKLFSGWMFASSPSLNPFEHPVYDLWLVDCVKGSG